MNTWQFWLELVVRSSLLLLLAAAMRRTLQAHAAALRHKLLWSALVLLGFLPVLSIVLPEIPISLWTPHSQTIGHVSTQQIDGTMPVRHIARQRDWLVSIWAFGVLVALTPILTGALSVARIVRRARPFGDWEHASAASVLVSDEVASPITCGFLHPSILLPACARGWSAERMRAVLSHELAHVRRRDVPVQTAAHLIAALWWFQPLVWVLRRALRSESELACDAEAVSSGLRPSVYAAELLAVARSLGRSQYALSSCGIDMAAGSNLEHRVDMILNRRPAATPLAKSLLAGGALAMAAVAASAFTLSSGQSFSEQGGSTMKRTLISGLLTSAGLTAATITGTVHDPSSGAVANATVTVLNPDTNAKLDTVTDSQGKFSLTGAPAGQYILKIEKAGFTPILREFDLRGDSNMERELTMSPEGSASQPADLVTDSDNSRNPVPVGGRVAQSNLLSRVQPIYPAAAKAAGTQGTVEIKATISKDGVPVDLQVVSTPSSDLAESALQAVRQWRYRPTLLNGAPVEISTTVIVNYTLSQ